MIKESTNKETKFERFRDFAKKVVSFPKAEIELWEGEYKNSRAKMKKRDSRLLAPLAPFLPRPPEVSSGFACP